MRFFWVAFCVIGLLALAMPLFAQDKPVDDSNYAPTRYGVAILGGAAYDPHHIDLGIIQGQMLLDYERVAWHVAPDDLRLKFEANVGLTADGRDRALLAVNMLALRYLERYASGNWTPYVEAGVGLIYTDFQVKGQGLRINFNPQAGAGVEYALPGGGAMMMALRLHHISNGNTYNDNRGVNSALLLVGYLF